jgi:hypothetical protein
LETRAAHQIEPLGAVRVRGHLARYRALVHGAVMGNGPFNDLGLWSGSGGVWNSARGT